MAIYQRKIKIVEATQWFPAMGLTLGVTQIDVNGKFGIIDRPMGYTFVTPGDYIVSAGDGIFIPIPAQVFEEEYDYITPRPPNTLSARPGWQMPFEPVASCRGCGRQLISVVHRQNQKGEIKWSLYWACPEFPSIDNFPGSGHRIGWPFEGVEPEPGRADWEALGFHYLESRV